MHQQIGQFCGLTVAVALIMMWSVVAASRWHDKDVALRVAVAKHEERSAGRSLPCLLPGTPVARYHNDVAYVCDVCRFSTRAHRWIIGYICHELRNPLHVLKSALSSMVEMARGPAAPSVAHPGDVDQSPSVKDQSPSSRWGLGNMWFAVAHAWSAPCELRRGLVGGRAVLPCATLGRGGM